MTKPAHYGQTKLSLIENNVDAEGLRPHWFLISDAGRAFLQIQPDLTLGETPTGQLLVGNRDQLEGWLSFRFEEEQVWLETASDRVLLSDEVGEPVKRQALRPGLILAMPNNQLMIGQDILTYPVAKQTLLVQQLTLDRTERDLMPSLVDDDVPIANGGRKLQAPTASRHPFDRYAARSFGWVIAFVLLALPIVVGHLDPEAWLGRPGLLESIQEVIEHLKTLISESVNSAANR